MSNVTFFTSTAGVAVPRILYGTAWKKERTTALVLQAFRAGFRGIDTACQPKHYDEAGVGGALRQLQTQGIRRGDYYLQTKFTPLSGQDPERVPYDPSAPLADQVAQSFAASCRNLHTDQLDGLILHSPLPTAAQTLTAWRAMEQIQQQGGTRQLGISNCYDLRVLQ
ncbi:MAG TPA: aldo/keto reductase, partial [Candidatus Kapabacteria bacterium]|nr:aldo/keto reductase [Candidatus Kapabacteria bacterium]